MLGTILVAIDHSELSEQVMQTLHHLKLETQTKIILVNVVPNRESEVEVAADRPQTNSEDFPFHKLEQRLQAYQAELPCPSEVEVVTGDPAEEIIRLANIHKVNLIMIGSRGLTGMERILQRSVSSQVVEEAACSVWVVKPS